jgi:hypothetical protein
MKIFLMLSLFVLGACCSAPRKTDFASKEAKVDSTSTFGPKIVEYVLDGRGYFEQPVEK